MKKVGAVAYVLVFVAFAGVVLGLGVRARLRAARTAPAAPPRWQSAGGDAAGASPAPVVPKPWERKTVWKSPAEVVAGTPDSFRRVMAAHGADRGAYLVALVDLECEPCRDALEFFKDEPDANKLAFTVTPCEEAARYAEARGFKFPLVSVTGDEFEGLGAVYLPTVLRAVDGRVVSAADNYRSVYPPAGPSEGAGGGGRRGGAR